MGNEGILARSLNKSALDGALADAHRHTWSILADLDEARWRVPYLPGINPPLWELGHLAWFAEWWILREAGPDQRGDTVATRPSMLADADRWFDSGRVEHSTRWHLDLPSLAALRDYRDAVLDAVRTRLADAPDDDAALYPYRLALFHEDMHGEALIYLRQTLNYASVFPIAVASLDERDDVATLEGGAFRMGSPTTDGFAFDNEALAHEKHVEAFTIDVQCVSNRAVLEFVEAGGYRDARFWSDAGAAWLGRAMLSHPARWRRSKDGTGERWEQLWFGSWQPLPLDRAVCHVNAYEAEAYCAWAGRRLPTEAEWELAATRGIIRWGEAVWEWMADPFTPYAGFVAGPYKEYSEPWFYTHRSVRGASFATHPRMRHPRYRNFYTPERNDIFVGFRTCKT